MNRIRSRRLCAALALVSTVAVLGACTTPPPYGGPPTASRSFSATSVTVNSSNDKTCVLGICAGANDEPFNIHVWFRVQIGVPNSADAGVVTGDNAWSGIFDQGPGEGGSHTYTGGQKATVNFSNIAMPDVLDLAQGAHLEIAGVWAWKMEADLLGVGGLATTAANAIKSALNSTLANGSTPSDPNLIVNTILDAIGGIGGFFSALGGLLASVVPFAGDDAVGSAMYVGIGASGTLADIINSTASGASFPSLALPLVKVPPDIGGGSIFSLGSGTKTFSNNFTNGGVDGRHTTSYTFG
jgi:hypothetical protein